MDSREIEITLTGDESCWPKNPKMAVYLGPWCFCGNKDYRFINHLDFKVIKSPYKSLSQAKEVTSYLNQFIERLIPVLANELNKATLSNMNEIYWETLTMPWLVHWIGIVFDRYTRLKNIENYFDEKTVIQIYILPSRYRKIDIAPLAEYNDHYNNLVLMSDILRKMEFNSLKVSLIETKEKPVQKISNYLAPNNSLKNRINTFFNSLLCDAQISIMDAYGMSYFDRISILFRIDPFFFLKRVRYKFFHVNVDRSTMALSFKPDTEFEQIVRTLLPKYLPEYFFSLCKESPASSFRVITHELGIPYTANKIAAARNNNAMLVSVQHGAGYGHYDSFPLGKIDYDLSDSFITWGWTFDPMYKKNKFIPLPSPLLSKLKLKRKNKNKILLVSVSYPVYFYRWHSVQFPEHIVEYINNRIEFINSLDTSLQERLVLKPYLTDHGTSECDIIKEGVNGSVNFTSEKNIWKLIPSIGLVVFDHLGTGFLEMLTLNIPAIVFFDKNHFLFHEKANQHIEMLKNAGIVFYSPQDAAKHINSISSDVESWWASPGLQDAIERFKKIYALSSKNWKRDWISYLNGFKKSCNVDSLRKKTFIKEER